MSPDYDIANPGAAELFESLRAFGYDLPTALADIVDNSIAANACNIWIDLIWAGPGSRIIIRDDGDGMTERDLVQAMRPGSLSPLVGRSDNDLGRFGLGMKTASISQCRCLTVLSRTVNTPVAVRRWDLDYIASTETGEWRLLKGMDLLSADDVTLLDDQESGTVLFWDRLDQFVGSASTDDDLAQKNFRERIDSAKHHFAMVFHRFLSGKNSITIHLNGRKIEPWDPFMQDTKSVDPLPTETLFADDIQVKVKPFILPHHSKISADRHALGAGPKGWNAHQGFYVYRNRRLLVAGDWLGLGMQKEEHFKLARIRIDLPNSADLAWKLDVKKSYARPPAALRKDLQRIARTARGRASRIYRHRGKILQRQHGDRQTFLWKHLKKHGKTFYKINRDHPLVRKVIEESADRDNMSVLLNLIEQTIPAPLIVINNAESPDGLGQPFEDSQSGFRKALEAVYSALRNEGSDSATAARAIMRMEPFNQYPELIAGFLDEISSTLTTQDN